MVRGSNFGTDAQNLVRSAAGTGLRAMEIYGIASLVVSIQPTRSHNKMKWGPRRAAFDPFWRRRKVAHTGITRDSLRSYTWINISSKIVPKAERAKMTHSHTQFVSMCSMVLPGSTWLASSASGYVRVGFSKDSLLVGAARVMEIRWVAQSK